MDKSLSLSKIIDRSEEQKAKRVDALRTELFKLGYSVVPTTFLAEIVVAAKQLGKQETAA